MSQSSYLLSWALGSADGQGLSQLTSPINWLHYSASQERLMNLCLGVVRLYRLRLSELLPPEGSLGSALRFHGLLAGCMEV